MSEKLSPTGEVAMKLCDYCQGAGHQLDGVIRFRPCWPCYGQGTTRPPFIGAALSRVTPPSQQEGSGT